MEVNSVENNWKFKNNELNNGFLKGESKIQQSIDSLLTSPTPVATCVQVSGSGTETTVLRRPRKQRSRREKLLFALVLLLVAISTVSMVLLLNATSKCARNGEFSLLVCVCRLLFCFPFCFVCVRRIDVGGVHIVSWRLACAARRKEGRGWHFERVGARKLREVKDGWMLRQSVWVF